MLELDNDDRLYRVTTTFRTLNSGHCHYRGTILALKPHDLLNTVKVKIAAPDGTRTEHVTCKECVTPLTEEEVTRILTGLEEHSPFYYEEEE